MLKDAILEDTIKITGVNREGKFYEKVSRVDAESELFKLRIQIDINTEIFPIKADEFFSMVILKSAADETYQEMPWMEKYDYISHGKIFKCDSDADAMYGYSQDYICFIWWSTDVHGIC